VGEVLSIRERPDRFNRLYAFVSLTLPDGNIDTVCFSKGWESLRGVIRKDSFGIFVVERTGRGFTLSQFVPLNQE
jgi:hypothetical protein